MDWLLIFIIFTLLLLSSFFSSAETSLTSISASRIHKLKTQGNKKAEVISKLNKKKEKVISTILIGNTIVNITASSLATGLFIEVFNSQGILLSSITMTILILLFAEMLPKTYAIQNPEKAALFSSNLIHLFVLILSPITLSAQYIVDCILKLLRLNKSKEVISAADAMRNLILLHDSNGTMIKQDLDMLSSILDLAETEISQAMTHRKNLFSLSIDQDIQDLIKEILASPHSRIPIWQSKEDNIIGIVHVKDLINILIEKNHTIDKNDIDKIMTKPWFIPDTTLLSMQLHNFRKNRKHFALVIDEYGDLQGIVTLEDILEEIVGDITDEHDIIHDNMIDKISENIYHINGEASIRDINRQLRWNIPDEEASTLSGIIVYEVERIPEEGEQFFFYGFKFKILKKKGNILSVIEVEILHNNIISH